MKIRTVEYAGTVASPGQAPPGDLPQIAFSGRSNVGKSSLINTLLGRTRKRIAHVSATPGKTQALNYYVVNEAFFLVDLPGYGYAKVPKAVRDAWQTLIDWYLGRSGLVHGVVHLVDSRLAPTSHDVEMVSYLADLGLPTLVVLTKMDKLKYSQRSKAVQRALDKLGLDGDQVLAFSSKTGDGRDDLLSALESLLDPGPDAGGPTEPDPESQLPPPPDGDGEAVGARP